MTARKALRGLFIKTEEVEVAQPQSLTPKVQVLDEKVTTPMPVRVKTVLTAADLAPDKLSAVKKLTLNLPKRSIVTALDGKGEVEFAPVVSPVVEQSIAVASASGLRILYDFDSAASERKCWVEADYQDFIKRLDKAQTEAFLLKGKLLDETKRRFFDENRMGWKVFCENRLDMNYTTANQYIRVALEFDVTSHQRSDLGFEHYKAMLPLPTSERGMLLSKVTNVSVKELRRLVQERLQPISEPRTKSSVANQFVRALEKLKSQIQEMDAHELKQSDKWQLSAACRELSTTLEKAARALVSETRSGAVCLDNEAPL